jgi:DNA (cytosine-5)-methyltransferase 3A
MNCLSIFDGNSGGRVAFERANIKLKKYFSSEIDRYAIQVANKNYPQDEVNRLGDVANWRNWDLPKIDILIGGSPCQGFSFAGKQLNFNDSRSALFFEFLNIKNHYNPKYFLLENVKMKKEYQDVISGYLGVEPIEINSSLVSAQSRKRLYWTNIPNIEQPKEKGLVLADVLKIRIKNIRENKILMSKSNFKVKVRKNYIDKNELCLFIKQHKNDTIKNISDYCNVSKTKAEHWFRNDSSFAIPDHVSWSRMKEKLEIKTNKYDEAINDFEIKNNNYDMAKRIYHTDGKHPTLTTLTGGGQRKTITDGDDMFYLSPIHCERLQTLPDNYTEGVSNTQRYKMLGNGWTIDVIAHILKGLKLQIKE